MRLADLVLASQRVAATRGRNAKIGILAELLARAEGATLQTLVHFVAGEIPQRRIGRGSVRVREALGTPPSATSALTIDDVDRALDAIAALRGAGAEGRRAEALAALFARATRDEQELLARLLLGELRQGALEGLALEAVALATGVTAAALQRAAMLHGALPDVARLAREGGEPALAAVRLELFRPVAPMLAQPAESVADATARFGSGAAEWKLDGARVQVHRRADDVRVYSRTGNDVTAAVPEIVETAREFAGETFVLDGEVIALRPDGRPHPFQTTMRRFGRRLDVNSLRASLPLRGFFFDALHEGGRDLLDAPLAERRRILERIAPGPALVPHHGVDGEAALERVLQDALAHGHEGVMWKALDSGYEAGRRGAAWLKVKPVRTLDLVVLAVEWGSGRRRGLLSNLHLGARDPASGGFVMVGKTFKGLTDEVLRWQTGRLLEIESSREDFTVFVQPETVVEIAFDGVQRSPRYPGGLALRFARVKGYRSDKTAGEADTIDALRALLPPAGEAGG